MASASGGAGYDDQVATELARLRDALDDLRRRPVPLDAATLRHVVTASLSEASAPPPNLLVTAIRRLDRVDARLEAIEVALSGQGALPRGAGGQSPSGGRSRAPAAAGPISYAAPLPNTEAIADALARRLAGVLAAQAPVQSGGGGARIEDLLDALRPLVPEAARNVLRRAGREPSAQAVEVLQSTALSALEEAATSLGPYAMPAPAANAQRFAPPPALAAAPAPPPAPPPLDLEALASSIAGHVATRVAAELRAAAPLFRQPVQPPEASLPPPPPDPAAVAEAVISRLAEQPPPQAVVSPLAMAPLLSVVGNVEAAVARLAEPEPGVVAAVDRLEAGVEALARALEDDRSLHAEEVRRGFAQVHERLQVAPATPRRPEPEADPEGSAALSAGEGPGPDAGADGVARQGGDAASGEGPDAGDVQQRLDRLIRQLAPLGEADLPAALPALATQGQRLERSLGDILDALATLAEHLDDQSSIWAAGFERVTGGDATGAPGDGGPSPADGAVLHRGLEDLAAQVAQLVAALAADRQRFQRLGGTMEGLAELLGLVAERFDRLPGETRVRFGPEVSEPRGDADDEPATDPAPPEAVSPVIQADPAPDGAASPVAEVAPAPEGADVGDGEVAPHLGASAVAEVATAPSSQPVGATEEDERAAAPDADPVWADWVGTDLEHDAPRPWWEEDADEEPGRPWWEDDDQLGVLELPEEPTPEEEQGSPGSGHDRPPGESLEHPAAATQETLEGPKADDDLEGSAGGQEPVLDAVLDEEPDSGEGADPATTPGSSSRRRRRRRARRGNRRS